MGKRTAAFTLALVLFLGLTAPASAAKTSDNQNSQNYLSWSAPVKSALYENEDYGLTRVEYINGKVVIEDYDASLAFVSGRTVEAELPLWGGFFAGSEYNFLFFGQGNPNEDDSREVIRIVKYDKDWNRLGAASLRGANTVEPFAFGSLRCDEYGGWLYIRTCHTMYRTEDGLNHQANVMIALRQSDMAVTDSYYDVMNISYGYVSHSFNQFVLVDRQGRIVTLDHGDAYPRSLVLLRYAQQAGQEKFRGGDYQPWAEAVEVQRFPGAIGDNTTGCSAGGLAETNSGYVTAYSYDGAGAGGPRDVYLGYVDGSLRAAAPVRLTNGANAATPQLVSTGLDSGYVMWNARTGNTLYYTAYDAEGRTGEIKTAAAALSDCPPIFWKDKVVWYTTSGSEPVFYTLDSTGVHRATGPFDDVPNTAWYGGPVNWAVNMGVTTGTGENTFTPGRTCTVREILTFLWRAAGSPEPDGAYTGPGGATAYYAKATQWAVEQGVDSAVSYNGAAPCTRGMAVQFLWIAAGRPDAPSSAFTDVPAGADYAGAVSWAVQQKITEGTGNGVFSPGRTCTRAEIVTLLYRAYA